MMYFALALALPAMTFVHIMVGGMIASILRPEIRFVSIIGSYVGTYFYVGFDKDLGVNETAVEIVFWLSVVISFIIWCWILNKEGFEKL